MHVNVSMENTFSHLRVSEVIVLHAILCQWQLTGYGREIVSLGVTVGVRVIS